MTSRFRASLRGAFPLPDRPHPQPPEVMAITLEGNYSKKLGLPGYSSHQYSITIRTELTDLRQVAEESARLYALLQTCVDREIQQTGWLPGAGSGNGPANGHANGHANGTPHPSAPPPVPVPAGETWNCTDKQRALILKLVDDHRLDKQAVEGLARERFGKGVRQVNRLEASGLIDELLETHGGGGRRNGHARKARAA